MNRDKYSIAYVSFTLGDQLHAEANEALRQWAGVLNCDYVSFDANADSDRYLTAVETYAAQGLDGLILEDVSAQARAIAICEEYGVKWYPGLSTFMDETQTHYIAPGAILDGYDCGTKQVDWTFDYYKSLLGNDFDPAKIGYIFLHFSAHPDFIPRYQGVVDRYTEMYPDLFDTNFTMVDILSGPSNGEEAFDIISSRLSTGGNDFDYWIIGTAADEFAVGAARAIEQIGIEDKCIVSAIFGGSVVEDWNAGKQSVWKSTTTVALVELTESMICGLLAVLDGRATFEDLYRDHVPEGENYGILLYEPIVYTYDKRGEYYLQVSDYIAAKYS